MVPKSIAHTRPKKLQWKTKAFGPALLVYIISLYKNAVDRSAVLNSNHTRNSPTTVNDGALLYNVLSFMLHSLGFSRGILF